MYLPTEYYQSVSILIQHIAEQSVYNCCPLNSTSREAPRCSIDYLYSSYSTFSLNSFIPVGLSHRWPPPTRCPLWGRQWSLRAAPLRSIRWRDTSTRKCLWCLWSPGSWQPVWAQTSTCPRRGLWGLRGTALRRTLRTRRSCR